MSMHERKRFAYLPNTIHGFQFGHGSVFVQIIIKTTTFYILHDVVERAIRLDEIKYGNDAWVLEMRKITRFHTELMSIFLYKATLCGLTDRTRSFTRTEFTHKELLDGYRYLCLHFSKRALNCDIARSQISYTERAISQGALYAIAISITLK